MLVLSRHVGEAVVVEIGGQSLRVLVGSVVGKRVQLGFAAPAEVLIRREELPSHAEIEDTRWELVEPCASQSVA